MVRARLRSRKSDGNEWNYVGRYAHGISTRDPITGYRGYIATAVSNVPVSSQAYSPTL